MPENTTFELIRTTQQLHAVAPAWSALWRSDSQATPFQSPEWLLPWWHSFGQQDLRTVLIIRNDRLIGILPFYVYSDPATGERQLLLLGVGTSDYLGGIFDASCTVSDVQQGLQMLHAEGGWDVLYATQLPPESLLYQAIDRSPDTHTRRFAGQNCWWMPAVPISELPRKIRQNTTYYRNRAGRLGTLTLELANGSNLDESFAALESLHTSSWQQRRQPGVFADPRVGNWHREALPLLQTAGILRLCSLRLNGEIIASMYSLLDAPCKAPRKQYVYLTAYSTAQAELRPGTVLLALVTEHAAQNGIDIIDLLRGDEAYKQMWHMEPFPTFGFSQLRSAYRKDAALTPSEQAA